MTTPEAATEPRTDASATVSPEEREQRLLTLTEALLDGGMPRQIVDWAMHLWRVSRRTAQAYVQDAQERLRADAQDLPPFYALQLSQVQRNRFLQQLIRRSKHGEELSARDFCTLVGMANKLLDSRDRGAAQLLAQETKQKSAQSSQVISDLKCKMLELKKRDQEWQSAMQQRAQFGSAGAAPSPEPLAPAPQPIPPPTPVTRASEDMDEDEEYDEWELDENGDAADCNFTPEELERMRREEEEWAKEEAEIAKDPVRKAAADREYARDMERIAYLSREYAKEKAGKDYLSQTAPASAAGAWHVEDAARPAHAPAVATEALSIVRANPQPGKDLRAERKRRRQEKRRLRRLRKRTRCG